MAEWPRYPLRHGVRGSWHRCDGELHIGWADPSTENEKCPGELGLFSSFLSMAPSSTTLTRLEMTRQPISTGLETRLNPQITNLRTIMGGKPQPDPAWCRIVECVQIRIAAELEVLGCH